MSFVNGKTLLMAEKTCLTAYRAAALVWHKMGTDISVRYGKVFDDILSASKMSYWDFFHTFSAGANFEKWLPFEVFFRLPPLSAEKFLGDSTTDIRFLSAIQGATGVTKVYGVIVDCNNKKACFFFERNKRTVRFSWNNYFGVSKRYLKSAIIPSIFFDFLLEGLPVISPINDWWVYKNFVERQSKLLLSK
jgi:hypothetical protein